MGGFDLEGGGDASRSLIVRDSSQQSKGEDHELGDFRALVLGVIEEVNDEPYRVKKMRTGFTQPRNWHLSESKEPIDKRLPKLKDRRISVSLIADHEHDFPDPHDDTETSSPYKNDWGFDNKSTRIVDYDDPKGHTALFSQLCKVVDDHRQQYTAAIPFTRDIGTHDLASAGYLWDDELEQSGLMDTVFILNTADVLGAGRDGHKYGLLGIRTDAHFEFTTSAPHSSGGQFHGRILFDVTDVSKFKAPSVGAPYKATLAFDPSVANTNTGLQLETGQWRPWYRIPQIIQPQAPWDGPVNAPGDTTIISIGGVLSLPYTANPPCAPGNTPDAAHFGSIAITSSAGVNTPLVSQPDGTWTQIGGLTIGPLASRPATPTAVGNTYVVTDKINGPANPTGNTDSTEAFSVGILDALSWGKVAFCNLPQTISAKHTITGQPIFNPGAGNPPFSVTQVPSVSTNVTNLSAGAIGGVKVSTTAPADGNALVYSSSAGNWASGVVGIAGGGTGAGLAFYNNYGVIFYHPGFGHLVSTNAPTEGQIVQFQNGLVQFLDPLSLTPASGSNVAGTDLNVCAGQSTGTQYGGVINFRSSLTTVSGPTTNNKVTLLTISPQGAIMQVASSGISARVSLQGPPDNPLWLKGGSSGVVQTVAVKLDAGTLNAATLGLNDGAEVVGTWDDAGSATNCAPRALRIAPVIKLGASTQWYEALSITVDEQGLPPGPNYVIRCAAGVGGTTDVFTVDNTGSVLVGAWNGTAIAATKGGTGQTTYTIGDMLYASSSTVLSKLGIGSTGNVLTVSGGLPVWASPSVAAHNLLSVTHGDTTAASVVRGDLVTGQTATPKWQRLAVGSSGNFLGTDGTDVAWKTLSGTTNQVTVSNASGSLTLATPQNIHSGASPTFAGETLTGSLTSTLGTVTVSTPALTGAETWNAGGVTFDIIKFVVTDTASAAASSFLRFTVGASDKFVVDKTGTITTGVWNGTAVDATHGGTAQTTWTTGDLLYASGSNALSKLGIGSSNQVLTVVGGIPSWSAAQAVTHNLLSATHPDTTAASVARGDLITGQTASPKWQRLAVGSSGNFLGTDGTDTAWKTLSGTANQVTVSNASGSLTLATPQNIHTAASPQFATLGLSTSAVANQVLTSSLSVTTTSGTTNHVQLAPTFVDGGATSSGAYRGVYLNPTINFTAVSKTGAYEALTVNVVETSLPTGTNYLLRLQAGATGGTDKFTVTNAGAVTTGTWSATAVDATHGGTAQTTWTTGDVLYASGSNALSKLGIGSTNQVLTVVGGIPSWAAAQAVTHNLLSATHPDTTAASVARGDVITGQTASPKWQRLAVGSSGNFLGTDGTDVAWKTLSGTANQVTVSNASGALTLATPQNIHTAATPQFASIGLSTAAVANQVLTSLLSVTTTSGTTNHVQLAPTFIDGGATSSGTYRGAYLNPTINFTAVSKTGAYEALTVNVVETALPTGTSYLLRLQAGATGGTDKFTITNAGAVTTGTWSATAIDATHGGTAQTTWTTGDVLYASGSNALSKLGIGSTNQVLTVVGGVPSWAAAQAVTHNLLSATHPDTTAASVARGDLITGQTASPKWQRLAVGSSGNFVGTDGTDVAWKTLTGTANQVNVANASGSLTLSAPQNIHTAANPQFGTMGLGLAAVANQTLSTSLSVTATSGTISDLSTAPTWVDGGTTSTTVVRGVFINPTVNFTAVSRTGSYEAINASVVETSLPTGTSYLLRLRAGAAGTTDKFTITNAGAVTTGSWQATAVAEIYGGTNQTTYATGDLLYASGSNALAKRAIGSTNQVLTVVGGLPTWAAAQAVAHNLLSATHSDTTAASVSRGDLVTGQGASPTWSRLAVGATGSFLGTDGTDTAWKTLSGTANRVTVANASGNLTLSGPQDIHTAASPTFAGETLTGTLTSTLGSVAVSTPAFTGTETWNGSGITFDLIKFNVTDTLSAAASSFERYQIAGADKWVLDKGGNVKTGTWQASVITEGFGGTNQSTYATGDMLYATGANTLGKRAIGSTNQVLTVVGGLPTWAAAQAVTHNLLSATHSDTTAASVVRGDLVTGQGASATWSRLAVGATGNFLGTDGTDAAWKTLTGTANRVTVSNASGNLTLTGPQDIHTGASPQFVSVGLSTAAVANQVITSSLSVTTTSGTTNHAQLAPSFLDGGTNSSGTYRGLYLNPTINFTAATKTGAYEGITVNVVETSLPTGTSYLLRLQAGTTGGTDKFTVTNSGTVTTGLWQASVITEVYGGTNQSSYATGDLLYATGANTLGKRAIGSTNQVLTVVGGLPTWAAVPAVAHNLLSATHTDTTAASVARGDLVTGQGASATWSRLAIGGTGGFLGTDGTDVGWKTLTGTANRVTVSNASGNLTLNGPQDIHSGASPTFVGLSLSSTITTTLGSISASTPVISATGTFNLGSVTFDIVKVNITDTASAAGSAFERYQIASSDKWVLDKTGTVKTGAWQASVITEIYGGTNQSSYTTGDILYASGSNALAKRAIGSTNQVLTVVGGLPTWAAAQAVAHNLLSATHSDTTAASVSRGDLVTGQGASPTWSRLAIGGTGSFLGTDGTDVGWKTLSGTANRVTVSSASGNLTLNGPQDIHTAASPQFATLGLGTAAVASQILTSSLAVTTTSGTTNHVQLAPSFADGGTNSSGTYRGVYVNPTINFTAATKTGAYEALTVNVVETALPTGASYLLRLQAGTTGGTDKFTVTNAGAVTTGSWSATAIDATHGGTNQTTWTTGDVLYASGSNALSKLGIGSTNQVLTVVGGVPSWAAAQAVTHALLSATHSDTTAAAVVRGDLVTGQGASATWSRLALGGTGSFLGTDGTDVGWKTLSGTANRVTVSNSSGNLTLSGPQDIHSAASPTFAGMTLTGSLTSTLGTVTVSTPALSGTETWNAGGVTFDVIKFTVTDTASAAASSFLRFTVGVTDKFVVDKTGTVTTGVWNGTAVDATHGGTAQTTWTTGDLLYSSGSNALSKLGIGSTNQVLTVVGGIPAWAAVPLATHNLLSATHPDTTAAAVVRGDLVTGQTASPKWQRLAVGSSGNFLGTDGTDVAWKTLSGTSNQISIANASGALTLATPQNIHTAATPQFATLGLSTAAVANQVLTSLLSVTTTSGTTNHLQLAPTFLDGGTTSSGTYRGAYLNPTINFTAATKTGAYEALTVNVVETALPTGANYLLRLQAGSTGGTDEFIVRNDGGTVVGAATGGYKGAGTLNAVNLYVNGTAVLTSIPTLGQVVNAGNTVNGVAASGQLLWTTGGTYSSNAGSSQIVGPTDVDMNIQGGAGTFATTGKALNLFGGTGNNNTSTTTSFLLLLGTTGVGSAGGFQIGGGRSAGTNISGTPSYIQASLATGNAQSGAILIQTAGIGASGASSPTPVTVTTIAGPFNNLSGGTALWNISPTWADGGATSTTIARTFYIGPTINYTAASKTGSYEALTVNVVETSLPTGTNYLLRLQAGTTGGTDKFTVTNAGAVTTGTWSATAVDATHGGTNQTTWTTGDLLYASGSNALSKLGVGSTNQVLTVVGGVPAWAAVVGDDSTFDIFNHADSTKKLLFSCSSITTGTSRTWTVADVSGTVAVSPIASSGTNIAGTGLTIWGGQSTGTAAGGDFVVQVAPASITSGTTVNALVTALTITPQGSGFYVFLGPRTSTVAASPQILSPDRPAGQTNLSGIGLGFSAGGSTGNVAGGSFTFNSSLAGASGTNQNAVFGIVTIAPTTNLLKAGTGLGSSINHFAGPDDQDTVISAGAVAGINIAGKHFNVQAGASTGNALGGSLIFKTSPPGLNGSVVATLVAQAKIDGYGNVFTNATGSAVSTSATNQFLHLVTCSGVPAGTPATTLTGATPSIFDSTNNKYMAWLATPGRWQDIGHLPKGYTNGFLPTWVSTTQISVAAGVARDDTDKYDTSVTTATTIDISGSTGQDSKVMADNVTKSVATSNVTKVITGTSTTFLTDWPLRALTGTSITLTNASTAVTGVGTKFLSEVAINDLVGNSSSGYWRVTAITDDTHLTIAIAFTGTTATAAANVIEQPTVQAGAQTIQKIDAITDNTHMTLPANSSATGSGLVLTGGLLVASIFVNVWVAYGASGSTIMWSTQRTKLLNPTTGYTTAQRRLYATTLDSSTHFFKFYAASEGPATWQFEYDDVVTANHRALSAGAATAFTSVDCSLHVPPTAKCVLGSLYNVSGAAPVSQFLIREHGSAAVSGNWSGPAIASVQTITTVIWNNFGQAIEYKVSAAGSTSTAYIDVVGYYEVSA